MNTSGFQPNPHAEPLPFDVMPGSPEADTVISAIIFAGSSLHEAADQSGDPEQMNAATKRMQELRNLGFALRSKESKEPVTITGDDLSIVIGGLAQLITSDTTKEAAMAVWKKAEAAAAKERLEKLAEEDRQAAIKSRYEEPPFNLKEDD